MENMNQEGREMKRRAEETMKAAADERELRRRLEAAKTPEDREPIKRAAFDCQGLHPANAGRFADVVADINRLNRTAPATGADVAVLTDETRRANDNAEVALRHAMNCEEEARKAREYPEGVALGIRDEVLSRIEEADDRELLAILQKVDGNRTEAARLAEMSQPTVSRRIYEVFRPAYEAAGYRVLPLFLLSPEERQLRKFDADAPSVGDGNKRAKQHGGNE